MISQRIVDQAVQRLVEMGHPTKIILFGSYGRGEAGEDSDLDFLIVKKDVKSRRQEMVRLRDCLRGLRVPADVLVVTEEQMLEWGQIPGTVLYEALAEGKVVYEAA